MPSPRRFPPPWSVEEQPACFVVRDRNGQQLAYFYFEEEPEGRIDFFCVTPVTPPMADHTVPMQRAGTCSIDRQRVGRQVTRPARLGPHGRS
jgi:hypothetical protein